MPDEKIKDAFTKVKEDITHLREMFELLSSELKGIRESISSLSACDIPQTDSQTDRHTFQTDNSEIETMRNYSSSIMPLEALKKPKTMISIGNGGVQTDRQTDSQTDKGTFLGKQKFVQYEKSEQADRLSHIDKVSEILDSLDELKRELRVQFKKLTPQEMSVFSAIYTLEDQNFTVDYALLSSKLSLSESAIRDYVRKLSLKGVPISKVKENNKRVLLTISSEFRRIAPLSTILALRNI